MSLTEVLFSRKEVLISLIVVGLVLLSAIGLAVGPSLYRRWKQIAEKRKETREARLAKREQTKRDLQAAAAQQLARQIAEAQGIAPAAEVEETPEEPPPPDAAAEEAPPAAADEASAEETPAAEAETEEEKQEEETGVPASAMQDILNSVFVDDEVDSRYDVLLQGVEVGSAEELLTMATKVATDLRTLRQKSG